MVVTLAPRTFSVDAAVVVCAAAGAIPVGLTPIGRAAARAFIAAYAEPHPAGRGAGNGAATCAGSLLMSTTRTGRPVTVPARGLVAGEPPPEAPAGRTVPAPAAPTSATA